MRNDESGGFVDDSVYELPLENPDEIVLGDWNGDDWLDAAVNATGVHILLNAHDGTFEYDAIHVAASSGLAGLSVGDLDGDDDLDLVVGSNGPIPGLLPQYNPWVTVFLDVAKCPPQTPGDLDDDGVVNGFDLSILLGDWGPCPARGPCPSDLNGDGVVNGMDLAILLAAWG